MIILSALNKRTLRSVVQLRLPPAHRFPTSISLHLTSSSKYLPSSCQACCGAYRDPRWLLEEELSISPFPVAAVHLWLLVCSCLEVARFAVVPPSTLPCPVTCPSHS